LSGKDTSIICAVKTLILGWWNIKQWP